MGTTAMRSEQVNPSAEALDMKLEVVVLPVVDVDRAKRFYKGLGWREDADFSAGDDFRVVQLTPPGSPCSIHFGKGLTAAAPGSIQGLYLVVDDIEAARAELNGHGADVSGAFHYTQTRQRAPGPDPERRSYGTYATFTDPDGNRWLLQEIKTRLPGRGLSSDVATLADLLREAEKGHGAYEPTAPKHHWSGWYASYIIARERGKTPDQAAQDAGAHMENERRAAQTDR
jgi:catechol 2,3-dioxygenase-like lactoylglutathione lyase family enzyme